MKFDLHTYDQIDSTNLEAKRLAPFAQNNLIITANSQLLGKGKGDRIWISKVGNLHMSILLTNNIVYEKQAEFCFIAGLAVSSAINSLSNSTISYLKWPNDIIINHKKCGGILIETIKIDNKNYLIIGIGINITNHPIIVDKATTCLNKLSLHISPPQLLKVLIKYFEYYYYLWLERDFIAIKELWLTRAYQLNQQIKVNSKDQIINGVFIGIDNKGNLLIKTSDYKLISIAIGEVF